jgi:hypothetical protein
MAKKNTGASTPSGQLPALKKAGSTGDKSQKTLHGFFNRTPSAASSTPALPTRLSPRKNNGSLQSKMLAPASSLQLTPAPSSDAIEPDEDVPKASRSPQPTGLPSPLSSANSQQQAIGDAEERTATGTPSRKVSSDMRTGRTLLTMHRPRTRSSNTPSRTAKVRMTMPPFERRRPRTRRGQ